MLALLYLEAIYARRDECVANIIRYVGKYDVVIYMDLCFLKMFPGKDILCNIANLTEFLE